MEVNGKLFESCAKYGSSSVDCEPIQVWGFLFILDIWAVWRGEMRTGIWATGTRNRKKINNRNRIWKPRKKIDWEKDQRPSDLIAILFWLLQISKDGCGKTKSCYSEPDSCKSSSDCDYLVTIRPVGEKGESGEVEFELSTKKQWAAIGFNKEKNEMVRTFTFNNIKKLVSEPSVQLLCLWSTLLCSALPCSALLYNFCLFLCLFPFTISLILMH